MSWSSVAFGDFAEIQPRVVLEKGAPYPFIEMSDVEPHTKSVAPGEIRIWNGGGGAKFENRDTIFARITPCLEHGKTAKIDSLTESRGFGSTEFFVFRARDNISDPDYIYYLACTPAIREPAIKSMIGASGRQRAQKVVIENTIIRAPEIQEQRRIASILSAYDDLIKNNRRRIQLLEQSARLLYKEWFVRLRFPGHEHTTITDGVPEGWGRKSFSELANFLNGYAFKPTHLGDTGFPIVKIPELRDGPTDKTPRNIGEHVPERYYIENGDILFSWSGTLLVNIWNHGRGILNQHLFKVMPVSLNLRSFIYFALKQALIEFYNQTTGATMKHIRKNALEKVAPVVPNVTILDKFEGVAAPMLGQISNLQRQSTEAIKARDLLLPRLMNGAVSV